MLVFSFGAGALLGLLTGQRSWGRQEGQRLEQRGPLLKGAARYDPEQPLPPSPRLFEQAAAFAAAMWLVQNKMVSAPQR